MGPSKIPDNSQPPNLRIETKIQFLQDMSSFMIGLSAVSPAFSLIRKPSSARVVLSME